MIVGRLVGMPGRLRPVVTASLFIPSQRIVGEVDFLVDTGADSVLLSPADALRLGLDTARLPQGAQTTGVGGTTNTVSVAATITLGGRSFDLTLQILVPRTRAQRTVLGRLPSLLGRDILAHFALFLEERTHRVLLLEPAEANQLHLP